MLHESVNIGRHLFVPSWHDTSNTSSSCIDMFQAYPTSVSPHQITTRSRPSCNQLANPLKMEVLMGNNIKNVDSPAGHV